MEKLKQPTYVTRAFLPPIEEYEKYLHTIWEKHWLTNNGELHKNLEKALTNYLGVKNVTLFVNGHSALDVAIKALKLKGEVITTPYTFVSTTHAIVTNNLKPVFCDIKMSDYTIDEEQIEKLITPKTSAIIAVHVYGYPCNVDQIAKIADKYNLKVIYDAAHAFGVNVNGVPIGNFGDVSMMSFHATKVFNTIEGGALLYKNDIYKREFELYKNFGITGQETVEAVGENAKMNEFQAAMGLVNLNYVDKEIEKRKKITDIYVDKLKKISGIKVIDIKFEGHNYAYFPILVDETKYGKTRNNLFEQLKQYNIFARKYFYPLTCDSQCFLEQYKNVLLPVARYVSDRILTLPIYGDLSEDIVLNICEIIEQN
ncbi:DegT/DnrJ/EryC1/StrS family aminotransferase [Pectinatus brassicae]|uniref:dTDP-4-amino-4,6-dideoxygalactose transaminase n=1 Tax=Pectinatus brassicae TaxID=862415 RepID=A0A840UVB3_9FIRM|nr:DegT/DnrJ/EryC1/StrS family aminotransferase [Pectinatus brassicae]MBB5336843.1 dTDP-4-amino-4,6-dideoxygalactose transaminase [Pectinatus brassicae]